MRKSNTVSGISPRGFDPMERVRTRVRELICEAVEEELDAALGALSGERCEERRGYRNGHVERRLLTEHGPVALTLPRARMFGEEREWRSRIAERYARRTKRIDEAILGCYLSGANTRRIRKALAPLFGEELLSKSTISRIVGKIGEQFEAWSVRDLPEEKTRYLFLDAIRIPVRLARRVVKVPVLAALGVREDGTKVLLSLRIAGSESLGSWGSMAEDLKARGLGDPRLVVCDGNAGLIASIKQSVAGSRRAAVSQTQARQSSLPRPQTRARGAQARLSRNSLRQEPRRGTRGPRELSQKVESPVPTGSEEPRRGR